MKGDIIFNVPYTMFRKDMHFIAMNDFLKMKELEAEKNKELKRESSKQGANPSETVEEDVFCAPYILKGSNSLTQLRV